MGTVKCACVTLVISLCSAGCATPAPASAPVTVTTTLEDVGGCTLVGKVVVADGANAETEARHETAHIGGNVLVRKNDQVWNGNAYRCPAAPH